MEAPQKRPNLGLRWIDQGCAIVQLCRSGLDEEVLPMFFLEKMQESERTTSLSKIWPSLVILMSPPAETSLNHEIAQGKTGLEIRSSLVEDHGASEPLGVAKFASSTGFDRKRSVTYIFKVPRGPKLLVTIPCKPLAAVMLNKRACSLRASSLLGLSTDAADISNYCPIMRYPRRSTKLFARSSTTRRIPEVGRTDVSHRGSKTTDKR